MTNNDPANTVDRGAPSPSPPFDRCPRCAFSLRGLPANHACPECGLRYDERSVLYRVHNPKAAVVARLVVMAFICLSVVLNGAMRAASGRWHTPGDLFSILWGLAVVVLLVWYARWYVRKFRAGYGVAITTDGLHIRIPCDGIFRKSFLPWADICELAIKPQSEGEHHGVRVQTRRGRADFTLGYLPTRIFPSRIDAERFVEHVRTRMVEAGVPDAGPAETVKPKESP
jgi:hypothetical protein